MISLNFLSFFFRSIIYSELKNLLEILKFFKSTIKFYNVFKLIIFFFNRDISPYKSNQLDKLLKTNKKYWINKIKPKNSEKILVECFINQQLANMSNMFLSKYLEKILNNKTVAVIRKNDFKSEVILRSFGINRIYKYQFGGFLERLKYIFLASKFISKLKNTKDLYNLKVDGIDVGLTTYDTWIRYSRIPTSEKININMVYILANALHAKNYYERLIKDENIKHLVQAEKQFVPLSISFQVALKSKVKVYAREGFNKITTRIYSNFSERNFTKIRYSYKALSKIISLFGKDKINRMTDDYYKFIKKHKLFGKAWANAVQNKSQIMLWKNKVDGNETFDKNKTKLSIDSLINYDKKLITEKFSWDRKKKIITIFFPYLVDGIYQNGRRNLFIDNYKWILSTLNEIKKIKKYNWLLREHPQEIRYKTKSDLGNILDEVTKKNHHIKKTPFNINPDSIINFTDVAVTCNGTAALEYQTFGKKVLIAENAYYNHFGFKKIPKNFSEYKKILNNIEKIKQPNKLEITKAKATIITHLKLSKTRCKLIPLSKPNYESRMNTKDEDMFWKEFTQNLKKNQSFANDPFYKMLKMQIQNNNQHTYNFKEFFPKNVKINDII